MAVSKFQPVDAIKRLYDEGQRLFGESRVQELEQKAASLPADIDWHFIGHLQTNKVAKLLRVPRLQLIQSVDTFKLLHCIDHEANKAATTVNILLELHVAREETKYGFTPQELEDWFEVKGYNELKAVRLCGLMGMASNTDDTTRVAKDFDTIAQTFTRLQQLAPQLKHFKILSMGMSGDYLIAIDRGANMVRVGSALFGERTASN